jgi:hypothetical protein
MIELVKDEEQTPEEKQLSLLSKFETIDFETGELINVLDSTLPVAGRVDAAKWLIDRYDSEVSLCKDRKRLWNDREDTFKLAIETIRESIKRCMQYEEIDKIKTRENTVYLTFKDVPEYDAALVPPENKLYDFTFKGVDLRIMKEFLEFATVEKLHYSQSEKIEPWMLPPELIRTNKTCSITFRKSPKSN